MRIATRSPCGENSILAILRFQTSRPDHSNLQVSVEAIPRDDFGCRETNRRKGADFTHRPMRRDHCDEVILWRERHELEFVTHPFRHMPCQVPGHRKRHQEWNNGKPQCLPDPIASKQVCHFVAFQYSVLVHSNQVKRLPVSVVVNWRLCRLASRAGARFSNRCFEPFYILPLYALCNSRIAIILAVHQPAEQPMELSKFQPQLRVLLAGKDVRSTSKLEL